VTIQIKTVYFHFNIANI